MGRAGRCIGGRMDRCAKLVAVAAAIAMPMAASAFVSPSPPPGFGGSSGSWTFTPPSPSEQIGKIMRGPGPSVGGAAASGAFRLGPGAARALAGGIARGLIPGVGLALGLAWLASNCFENQGGQWVRTCGPGVTVPPVSEGLEFRIGNRPWFLTREEACSDYMAWLGASDNSYTFYDPYLTDYQGAKWCQWKRKLKSNGQPVTDNNRVAIQTQSQTRCPAGWYITPAGCVYSFPKPTVTPEQIEEEMSPKPLPQQLPPGVPYPLDPQSPFIFNPDTANPPNARPLRVPQGNPVPVPNSNPQQYRQPVIQFIPSPTAQDPFRLDARPEDVVTESPTGMTGPETVGPGSPGGEKPEQFDLCKEHPDIIACQVFKPDELTPSPVPNKEVPLSLVPSGGFPVGGSCPQPKSVQLMGRTFSFSMQPLCDFALGIKPLLIGFAWLSAALVFLGVARREN